MWQRSGMAVFKAVLYWACCVTPAIYAQDFPAKPISLVVPVSTGGIVDLAGRLAAQALTQQLGTSVVVENRAGASANIGMTWVAQAQPDGYTLLASYALYHTVNPLLFSDLKWGLSSFTAIGRIAVTPSIVVVHPSLPVTSLDAFVTWARQHPGEVRFASQGVGSVAHLGSELLKSSTGITMTHVPYKGSAPAMQDLIAGRVQFFITAPAAVLGYIQQGRLRALAVASTTRHPMFPDVPTAAEQGYPALQLEPWVGLFAPAGTPQPIVDKLAAALAQGLAQPDIVAKGQGAGAAITFQPPGALTRTVAREHAAWAELVQAANISIE